MRILFYQKPPHVNTTMLTWTLGQELILRGHEVIFEKGLEFVNIYKDKIDWVRTGSFDSYEGVEFARKIGAKVHVHLEGVGYWRIGAESALKWGYPYELSKDEINHWRVYYQSWMNSAFEADSCSVNGKNQIDIIENDLFNGRRLPNCHRLSCGVDARYAMSIPNYQRNGHMVTVSRLEPNKKVMMIAKALSLMDQNKLPVWIIVGNGNLKQTTELREFVKKYRIKTILKPCFGAEKWYLIKNARIMLQGWSGLPPGEGLVCDTPVLSFDHPDIVEMYENSIWWADDNDPESFAEKLKQLLDTPEYILRSDAENGSQMLLDGKLYACTQSQLAEKYTQIFEGKAMPWNDSDGWSVESADPIRDLKDSYEKFRNEYFGNWNDECSYGK